MIDELTKFNPNTKAKADEINQNFEVLRSAHNALYETVNSSNKANLITGEIPGGNTDGINKIFITLNNYAPTTVCVYRNGLRQDVNVDYIEEPPCNIIFFEAPLEYDLIVIDYLDGENELSIIFNEMPIGLMDGVNTEFITAYNFRPGSLEIYKNGIKLSKNIDFIEISNNKFSLFEAPLVGDRIVIDYKKQS